ncbi:HAUS augmin-like complex subunit 5 isoform X2 [Gigantopelta aegis]|uniref:HAUS augmin-like complex subunit 5 isoform X2 n=1 Tax=Gigantopelta aegis TaxID=1735272 RepID=UPI001B88BAC3|nr:HAUS augmin-like complex subunit 5 isoform X2 [Gigantopelta aegis]
MSQKVEKSAHHGSMKTTADVDLGRQLHDWAIKEMHFQPTGRYVNKPLPSPEDFQKICRGSDLINVWKFVLGHVRSLQSVKKVKENVKLKKYTDQADGKGRPGGHGHCKSDLLLDKRAQLLEDLTVNLKDIGHLETDFHRLENDLIQTDKEYKETVARIQNIRRQAGLLDVKSKLDAETVMEYKEFKERVTEKTDFFTKKAKSDGKQVTLYHKQSAGDETRNTETACCHEVREICDGVESFLQDTLQGTFGDRDGSCEKQQRILSLKVDEVLSRFPANDMLQALITNTYHSSVTLRERTLHINIKEDVEKLKFKHEKGGQLTDISAPVTLLHGVHELIEKGQRDHVDRYIEMLDHRNTAHRTHKQAEEMKRQINHTLKKLFENKPTDMELAKKLIGTEVKLAEERSKASCLLQEANNLKEQIHQASKEKEFLIAQYQKIKYFKDVAQRKQNHIQVLAKQNAGAQPRLDGQKTEIVNYVCNLSTHHADTVLLARRLDGAVIAEVNKMIVLALPYCLMVFMDSATKIPVIDLSIHHASHPISSAARPAVKTTLHHLKFPYEKADECILAHCLELKSRLVDTDRLTTDLRLTNKKIRGLQNDEEDSVENITSLCGELTESCQKEMAQLVPLLQQSVNT